ncbi:hypothetical protein GGH98_004261, partial [Coemansia sp. RSA 454]
RLVARRSRDLPLRPQSHSDQLVPHPRRADVSIDQADPDRRGAGAGRGHPPQPQRRVHLVSVRPQPIL